MANEDKKRALDAAIAKLEKDFGKGTVMRLGDPSAQVAVETIPTGSLSLDLALGLGGVPKGRIVEIYGCEGRNFQVVLHERHSRSRFSGNCRKRYGARHVRAWRNGFRRNTDLHCSKRLHKGEEQER